MHSSIIQLSPVPIGDEERMEDIQLYDEPVVMQNADYVGNERTGEDREEAILALAELFGATYDKQKGLIVFPEPKVTREMVCDQTKKAMAQLRREGGYTDPSAARMWFRWYKDSMLLIRPDCVDDGVLRSGGVLQTMDFLYDLSQGYYPREMYVGAVFDYHS